MSIVQRFSPMLRRAFSTARTALSASEPVAPRKGLYQFFENGEALPKQTWTGRSWKADELRQKSFDDLHKLWYVLLKERNLLATQREEAKRLGIKKMIWTNEGRLRKCQQSMARIKFVLSERQRHFAKAETTLASEATETTQAAEAAANKL